MRSAAYSKVPIIMLTAKGDERDELLGFDLGVDEYITKPFSPKDSGCPRGSDPAPVQTAAPTEDIMAAGGIELNKAAHQVNRLMARPIELSFKEFELLAYFMENQGVALSREKIS